MQNRTRMYKFLYTCIFVSKRGCVARFHSILLALVDFLFHLSPFYYNVEYLKPIFTGKLSKIYTRYVVTRNFGNNYITAQKPLLHTERDSK